RCTRELRTRAPGARSRADLTVLAAVDPATGFLRADFAVPRTVNPDRVEPRGDACVAGGCKSSAAVDRGADFALPRAANFHGCRAVRRCVGDRKSTRLNSSHVKISYAVFC